MGAKSVKNRRKDNPCKETSDISLIELKKQIVEKQEEADRKLEDLVLICNNRPVNAK